MSRKYLAFLTFVGLLLTGIAITGCPTGVPGGSGVPPVPTDLNKQGLIVSNDATLKPNAKLITSNSGIQVNSVQANTVILSGPGASQVKVGDILFSSDTPPILKKVISVTPGSDGTFTITTEDASLEDVFNGGSIEIAVPYGQTGLNSRSINVPAKKITNNTYNLEPAIDLSVDVDVDMSNLSAVFKANFGPFGLRSLDVYLNGTATVSVSSGLSIGVQKSFSKEIPLIPSPLFATLGPVLVTNMFYAGGELNLSATGSVRTTQARLIQLTNSGVRLDPLPHVIGNVTVTDVQDDPWQVALNGDIAAGIFIKDRLAFELFGIVGPYIDIRLFPLKATFSVSTGECSGDLAAGPGLDISVGGKVSVFGHSLGQIEVKVFEVYANWPVASFPLVAPLNNSAPVANMLSVNTPTNTPKQITLSSTDIDGNPVTYTILQPPSNGTVANMDLLPTLTYYPNNNYTGTDTFSYFASDCWADGSPATVTINVQGSGGGTCVGKTCETYTWDCNPGDATCVCYKTPQGSICGRNFYCNEHPDCINGQCPVGYTCVVETCCDIPKCMPDSVRCNSGIIESPEFELRPGEPTAAGQLSD